MTDERFVFQQDVKERQKMKTGAAHKKGAKRTTNCKFPSDYLTMGQRKKLSGPVISIKMDLPYFNWKEFKKLPEELQIEYINNLINKYGARLKDIAEMFNVCGATVSNTCKAYKTPVIFKHGGIVNTKMDERWLDFITKPGFDLPSTAKAKTNDEVLEERLGIEPIKEEKKEETVMEDSVARKETRKEMLIEFKGVDRLNLAMNGTRDVIIGMLESVLGTDCDYTIKIDISRREAVPGSMEVSYCET